MHGQQNIKISRNLYLPWVLPLTLNSCPLLT